MELQRNINVSERETENCPAANALVFWPLGASLTQVFLALYLYTDDRKSTVKTQTYPRYNS